MKSKLHISILALSFGFTTLVSAQYTDKDVAYYIPNENNITASSICHTTNEDYMISGEHNMLYGLILKVNHDKTVNRATAFTNISNNAPYSKFYQIINASNNQFLAIGSGPSTVNGHTHGICIQLNEAGDTLWSRSYGINNKNAYLLMAEKTADDGFIMAGYTEPINNSNRKILLIKTDQDGTIIWFNEFNINDDSKAIAYAVKQLDDMSYIVSGKYTKEPTYNTNFILKLTASGTVEWCKSYLPEGTDTPMSNDLLVNNQGYILLTETEAKTILIQTDTEGSMLWQKEYTANGTGTWMLDNINLKIVKTHDNNYLIEKTTWHGGTVIKTDTLGNMKFASYLELNATGIIENTDNSYSVVGYGPLVYVKKDNFQAQIGLIHLTNSGHSDYCGYQETVNTEEATVSSEDINVTEESSAILTGHSPLSLTPLNVNLHEGCVASGSGLQNNITKHKLTISPNPSTGIFTVNSGWEIGGELIIYNNIGQIISRTCSNTSHFNIDITTQTPGIYLYQFTAEDHSIQTGKIMISK